MRSLEDQLFRYLSDAFVARRSVDMDKMIRSLETRFPDVPASELVEKAKLMAASLEVRIRPPVSDRSDDVDDREGA